MASREAAAATAAATEGTDWAGTRALLRLVAAAAAVGDCCIEVDIMPLAAAAAAFRWAITCDVLAGTTPPLLAPPLAMLSSPVVGRRPTPLLLVAARAPVDIELPVTEVAADCTDVGLLHRSGCCCCCWRAGGVCRRGSPLATGDVFPDMLPSLALPLRVSPAAAAAAAACCEADALDGEQLSGDPGVPPPPPPPPIPALTVPPAALAIAELCWESAASLAINTVDCKEKETRNKLLTK